MIINTENIDEIRQRAVDVDASTSLVLIEEALARGIKVELPYDNFKLLWLGDKPVEIRRTMTHQTSAIGVAITTDKTLCYGVAESVGMRVLPWIQTLDREKAIQSYRSQSGNCILKPVKGQAGRDITTSFSGEDDFLRVFDKLRVTDKVIVQGKADGKNDARLLFIDNKFVAATSTRSTELEGDGIRTLSELVQAENKIRSQGNESRYPTMLLKELELNSVASISSSSLNSVVPPAEKIEVSLSNATKGGIATDVTHSIHQSFILEAQKLVDRLNLPVVAVDFIAETISPDVDLEKSNAFFLEANSSPGIDLHMYPHEGSGVNVAEMYIDYLLEI